MQPNQALDNLYRATRNLNVNAETHEALAQCYQVVKKELESEKES